MLSLKIPTGWIALSAICFLRIAGADEVHASAEASGSKEAAGSTGTADAAVTCFEEAKALFKASKFREAADKFREAYGLKPSWKLLYNIGQSEAAAKQYGLALEAFEQFLSEGGDDIAETRRDEVLKELDRLRKMVGFFLVNAPSGTVVYIDDEQRGSAPVRTLLAVSAGVNHQLRGELDGKIIFSETYKVIGNQTMEVDMIQSSPTTQTETVSAPSGSTTPPAESSASKAPSLTPQAQNPTDRGSSKDKSPLVMPGFIVAGVGAAAAVGGIVLGGLALSKNADLKDACSDTSCPDRKNEVETRDRMSTSSTALIAAGGTVFAAGVSMIIIGKIREKKRKKSAAIRFYPVVDETSASASFEWRF